MINITRMLDFYGLEYTTKDQPGKFGIVLYTNLCNFRCYGCHNRTLAGWDYKTGPTNKGSPKQTININANDYHNKLTLEEIELAIKNDFLDVVILCGGETLVHSVNNIVETINRIKKINKNVKIRIDTNGSFPEKIKELIKTNLVDGFAIDIKGPYWIKSFYKDISKILGISEKVLDRLNPKLIESIKLVDGMDYSLFRTVYYPIISNKNYFEEIKTFAKKLKSPHFFNIFQEI